MMKKLIFSSLSALVLLTAAVPSVKAQEFENTANIEPGERSAEKRTSPFALVSAAYRGRFEDWNIPGYEQLDENYRAGKVNGKDLVNAGIKAGELSPQAAGDKKYIDYVDGELNSLTAPSEQSHVRNVTQKIFISPSQKT